MDRVHERLRRAELHVERYPPVGRPALYHIGDRVAAAPVSFPSHSPFDWSKTMDKTVLNLDDLLVDSFITSGDQAEVGIVWTGCMSECTAC
jgi:hypothetical protein